MKRRLLANLLLLVLFSTGVLPALAQTGQYGNEWIDYSKTYYKFKVGKTGICRIYRPALDAAGVPASVTGSNFSLYRDGVEVPVWVSNENMGSGDYIEFFGRKADGSFDRELFLKPEHQSNDRQSLFTDTACYFLTYDAGSSHLRYQQAANTIPGGTLTPEPYQLATTLITGRDAFNPGASYSYNRLSDELVSSQFDDGEGFVYASLYPGTISQFGVTLSTPNLVAGIAANLTASIVSRSFVGQHSVKLLVNNNLLADSIVDMFDAKRYNVTVPASQLSTSNSVQFVPTSPGPGYDLLGLAFAEIEYPRDFNMAGLDQGYFRLPATGSSQYIEVSNFGAGRLYDVSAGKWYDGNTAVAGKTRFYLDPASTNRDIVLLKDGATSITSLSTAKTIRFTNYSSTTNQGNFVIISHTNLMQPVGGHNYVQEYAAYRSSATGGSHMVSTADVTELYDQFGYGYDIHPLAIKHFLKYAYDTWPTKPVNVMLIGRGIFYNQYTDYRADPVKYSFPIVPTYGHPGSDVDFVLFGTDPSPKMRLGRLSVWNAAEIGTYLNKIQAYEQAAKPAMMPTLATELWKKRVMHVIGAQDKALQDSVLTPTMSAGAVILRDTFTGKTITTIAKSTNSAIQQAQGAVVDSLLRGGTSMISFFGHGSPVRLDYSLPGPTTYSSTPRIPFFMAMGCDVSQMFELSPAKTIAEQYVLAPNAGSTAFLGSDYVSFTDFDANYIYGLYNSIAHNNYGASLGQHYNATHDSITHIWGSGNVPNSISIQLETMIFSGDPSVTLPDALKPDYYVDADGLSAIPGNVSTSLDTFKLRINTFNLGKALRDTVLVKVEHINPANNVSVVASYTLSNLHYSDTTTVSIPVNKVDDLGLNKYKVTIDAASRYDETSEMNNVATLELFIYSDNLVPIVPREFAIVNTPSVTLKGSTLNPFRALGRYKFEIDTTTLFNSPLKQQTTITSKGGVIKWTPTIPMIDSTVYYWRTAFDSVVGGSYIWANSSFIYLPQSSEGWNQSHFYQFGRDNYSSLFLHPDRVFRFGKVNHKLEVRNMVIGGFASQNVDGTHVQILWDDLRIEQSSYTSYNALQIMVIDSLSGRIWINWKGGPGYRGPAATFHGLYTREFDMTRDSSRYGAVHFLEDSVRNGDIVMIKNVLWHPQAPPVYIDSFKKDTLVLGPGRSLYHSLYNLGFTDIDKYTQERAYIFLGVKGDPTHPRYQWIGDSLSSMREPVFQIQGSDSKGQMNSTVIGPAKSWDKFIWKTSPNDTIPQTDTASVTIIGIDVAGNETTLFSNVKGDTSLTGISAQQYPNLKLLWDSKDVVNLTSTQLRYWRVLYTPVPEAALNPSLHYVITDTLSQGQMQTFSTAIENLTPKPMDSMLVRYKIIGADGVTRQLADRRYRPLTTDGDTLHASITFDASPYPGKNFLFIEANPANDQPEQYHPNNLGYVPFKVGVDTHNPMLDVTFDGIHILNGDIINPKPLIKMRLKDENPFLSLDDTSLLKVSLRYPPVGNALPVTQEIPFDGTTCRFIPATKGTTNNEASVEYRPNLTQDGIYQLVVSGADKTGNGAGTTAGANRSEYKIEFEVDSKPSITNILNYPNPFSTATAFVFTLTGSQVPSQLKIQILSVTGKVVREITRQELGPIHIGRNITEYQWDGRDQYGQLLGNGVYLYRVVTSLNGEGVELRTDAKNHSTKGDGIDKYFKNGYGKMYIMR